MVATMPESAAGGPEPSKKSAGLLDRLKHGFLLAEETVVVLKNLSIVGLIGTIVGSYFQYVSWREEQNIARYKEDFAAATEVFASTASALSTAMNLQQLVYFTYRDAIASGADSNDDAFQTKSGRDIYKAYVDARNSLRQNIDTIAHKMEIYIDWPSDRGRDPTVQMSNDPLNSHSIGSYDFDCDKYFPDYHASDTLKPISIPKKGSGAALQVDWRSTKHHVATFQYCFERAHAAIFAARAWASKSPVDADSKNKFIHNQDNIQSSLDNLVERHNALMLLTKWRIEDIRHRYQTKNYACHLFPVARWCA
jgi:hypothetical protein